jgi:hypothetical protein
MSLTQMNLRDLRSVEGALNVARLIGYTGEAVPFAGSDLGLRHDAIRLRSHGRADQGYGLLIATVNGSPRSFRTLGRRLVEGFHDRPLAIFGLRGPSADWRQAVVVRPRLIEGGGGAVSIARLTLDPEASTAHDVEVLSGLAWRSADAAENHRRIDGVRAPRRNAW